jgi:hypothetical protein
MSTARTDRLAKIDRLIDFLAQHNFLAQQLGEIPAPGVNWGLLLEFADLTEEDKEQARIALDAYDQNKFESLVIKQLEFDARVMGPLPPDAIAPPPSIKDAVREQLAGLAQRQAARAEKRRVKNIQALAKKRVPPEQRVDRRKGAW